MGKRRKETPKPSVSAIEDAEEIGEESEGSKGERFFACYLLTSLCPRFKGQTYIGFTVNPRRRIRQHNGEIRSGAWRTKQKRPWEMVLCIYGFPTNVAALQFEWAWQHPVKSLAVRGAAAGFKSLSGLANKIKLAYMMLTLPAWQSLNLTVNFFSTKYQMHISGCPALPEQMQIQVCSMDELPCYDGNAYLHDELEVDEECNVSGSDSQASAAEESIAVLRTVHGSPSSHDSSQEEVHVQISQKDESSSEISKCSDETWREFRSSSPSREDDQGQPFVGLNDDSPLRATSSHVDYDENVIINLDSSLQKQLPAALSTDEESVSIQSPGICDEVEIIDIFTPSPCYLVNSGSKKRRRTGYTEIIDLTNSPMFV